MTRSATNPAVKALHRAQLRVSAYGFRQGRAERPASRRPNLGFTGYSLADAVLGIPIAGETREPDPAEETALVAIAAAIDQLYPEVILNLGHLGGRDLVPTLIEAFNDAEGRTRPEIMNVLERAKNLAAMGMALPSNEGEKINTAPKTEEPQAVAGDAPDKQSALSLSESAADINGAPTPEAVAPVNNVVDFHPLDRDKDGKPGGSLPAADRGLDALFAEAEALGVAVDRRWGVQALLDAIHDAKAKKDEKE